VKRALTLGALCAAGLALAGCGGKDTQSSSAPTTTPAAGSSTPAKTATPAAGTAIKLGRSDYGRILYDARGQAIYLFTKDARNRTRCFGECAKAWPPVYTTGSPKAVAGVDQRLLGTIRREGKLQVTYRGQPLYFYAHEGPNQVLCQNVNEFGGTWLVVKRSGDAVR
jgi:predicted lipoprotein with Yx(FWY)xxD motif